jgi:hypothetical protein
MVPEMAGSCLLIARQKGEEIGIFGRERPMGKVAIRKMELWGSFRLGGLTGHPETTPRWRPPELDKRSFGADSVAVRKIRDRPRIKAHKAAAPDAATAVQHFDTPSAR